MNTTTATIRIFLNTWRNYNTNGADGGFWIDLPCDIDEALEKLANSTGEEVDEMEVFVNDFETEIDGLEISENSNVFELNELAETIDEMDDDEIEKLLAIIEVVTSDINKAIEYMDSYEYISGITLSEYAAEAVSEMGLPEFAERYFDYEAFERDLTLEGYTETENGLLINN